jgi:hypothetical protein
MPVTALIVAWLLVVRVVEYSTPSSDRNVDTCAAATNAIAPGTTRPGIPPGMAPTAARTTISAITTQRVGRRTILRTAG